jgi:hypothetical protein
MALVTLLAVNWSPELRGIIVVLIGIGVLMGSIYLLLTTNLGSRLGFLVVLAGLSAWLMMMGIMWWVYGIGLKGNPPAWKGKEVIGVSLDNAGSDVVRGVDIHSATTEHAVDGWKQLHTDDPSYGQDTAAADDILQNQLELFKAGEYKPMAVYNKGGERFPKINDTLDFLAFFHEPHYSLVEVQPVIPSLSEPGRAPPTAVVDTSKTPTYVLMERNLGTTRQPSVTLTFGAGLIFLLCCWTLHRRDLTLRRNLEQAKAVVPARAST